jgi:hypothetical protein
VEVSEVLQNQDAEAQVRVQSCGAGFNLPAGFSPPKRVRIHGMLRYPSVDARWHFGVLAYSVRERTRELGIRIALGARRGDLIAMVLRQALTTVLIGIALGVGGSLLLSRSLSSLLFGVSPVDGATFVLAASLFIPAALLASYWPAKHALSVDPLTALRFD